MKTFAVLGAAAALFFAPAMAQDGEVASILPVYTPSATPSGTPSATPSVIPWRTGVPRPTGTAPSRPTGYFPWPTPSSSSGLPYPTPDSPEDSKGNAEFPGWSFNRVHARQIQPIV